MPWRIKRTVGMILLGVAALVLGIIALVQNQSITSELLAAGLVVGGLAIVLNVLPANGNGDH